MFLFQPMEWVILRLPVWAMPPVLNLNHHLHLMPTARNTDGKRAQASQSQMAYLQAMKVQHTWLCYRFNNFLKQKIYFSCGTQVSTGKTFTNQCSSPGSITDSASRKQERQTNTVNNKKWVQPCGRSLVKLLIYVKVKGIWSYFITAWKSKKPDCVTS